MSIQQVLQSLNGQSFRILAAIVIVIFLIWSYGCQSTTRSMLDDSVSVTRAELTAEAAVLNARYAKKVAELDMQDQVKSLAIESVSPIASGGSFNLSGLLTGILGIAGVAYGIDKGRQAKSAITKNSSPPQ